MLRVVQRSNGESPSKSRPVTEPTKEDLEKFLAKENDEICQILGKAIGYPWYKDDQKNFPGATEEDGVCVGAHVSVTIAMEAADRIRFLEQLVIDWYKARKFTQDWTFEEGDDPARAELHEADRRLMKYGRIYSEWRSKNGVG